MKIETLPSKECLPFGSLLSPTKYQNATRASSVAAGLLLRVKKLRKPTQFRPDRRGALSRLSPSTLQANSWDQIVNRMSKILRNLLFTSVKLHKKQSNKMKIFLSEHIVGTIMGHLYQMPILTTFLSQILASETAKCWTRLSKMSLLLLGLRYWKIRHPYPRNLRLLKSNKSQTKSLKPYWARMRITNKLTRRKKAGKCSRKPFSISLSTSSMTHSLLTKQLLDCPNFTKMFKCIPRWLISLGKKIRWQLTT